MKTKAIKGISMSGKLNEKLKKTSCCKIFETFQKNFNSIS
jgi:hypothetical protein